jgi:chromosome segregation ATPase
MTAAITLIAVLAIIQIAQAIFVLRLNETRRADFEHLTAQIQKIHVMMGEFPHADELVRTLGSIRDTIGRDAVSISRAVVDLEIQSKRLNTHDDLIQRLDKALLSTDHGVSEIATDVEKLQGELALTQKRVDELVATLTARIAAVEEKVGSVRTGKLRARVTTIEEQVPKILENVNRMVTDLTDMQNTVRSLKNRSAIRDQFAVRED